MDFSFTAIVGQEELKTALILNVIDPGIGGLLVMGEKGTAKSTAVRALAELLPELTVVRECRFRCQPDAELCSFCQERKQDAPPYSSGRVAGGGARPPWRPACWRPTSWSGAPLCATRSNASWWR